MHIELVDLRFGLINLLYVTAQSTCLRTGH